MSAQTSVTTIGNILVMHSFLTDISTDPVSFHRSAPTVVQTNVPAIRKTAEVGLGASPNSRGFVKMLSDYHASGALARAELRDLSVKPGPRHVLAELKPVFDNWELAVWFVQPNSWLQTKRPLDLLDVDFAGVLEAARAHRFSAAG